MKIGDCDGVLAARKSYTKQETGPEGGTHVNEAQVARPHGIPRPEAVVELHTGCFACIDVTEVSDE